MRIRIQVVLGSASLFAACGGTGPDIGEVAQIVIDPQPIRVEVRDALQLQAVLTDEAGRELNRSSVHWSIENPSVAEVSSAGVVTGKSIGSTRVAASAQGVDGLATVTVIRPGLAIVTVAPNRVDLREGESRTLAVEVLDRLDEPVTGVTVEWRSADTKIAQVSSSGRVTAVAPGTTKVTATVGAIVGESTIEVAPRAVATVDVSPSSATLDIGGTRQLNVTSRASDGTILNGRAVTWSSSDPQVASVSSSGLVTARGAGNAIIKATVEGKDDTASIRVRNRGGGD